MSPPRCVQRARSATCSPSRRQPRRVPRPLRQGAMPVRRGRDRHDDERLVSTTRCSARRPSTWSCGALGQAAADDARRAARRAGAPPFDASAISLADAASRVLRARPWRQDVSSSRSAIGRWAACARATSASARGRCRWPTARPRCCRSTGTARGVRRRRAHAAGRRRRPGVRADGGGRGAHQSRRRAVAALSRVKLSANWMAAAGARARTRPVRHGARRRPRPLPGARR